MLPYSGPHLALSLLLSHGGGDVCQPLASHCPNLLTAWLYIRDWDWLLLCRYLHIWFHNAYVFPVVNPYNPLPPVNSHELLTPTSCCLHVYIARTWWSIQSPKHNSTWPRTVCTPSFAFVVKKRHAALPKERLEKHWKAVVWGGIEKSDMVDHTWKEKRNHLPLWDEVKIIDWEEHWRIRHLLSRLSIEINIIWEPIIKKVR